MCNEPTGLSGAVSVMNLRDYLELGVMNLLDYLGL